MAKRTQIEKQIQTIEGLKDIIGSMRSLAAIYLSRCEERLDGIRAYSDTVGRAIEDCLHGRDIALPASEATGVAVLAFFSEQGLCGRFNEVMAEAAVEHSAGLPSPSFIVVGRRGPALLRRAGLPIMDEVPGTTSPDGQDAVIHRIARTVFHRISSGDVAQLYLLHAHYLSPGKIAPTFARVLPVDLSQWRDADAARRSQPRLALSRLKLLGGLVDEYAFVSLFRAMTESLAGENGMRLQSMEAARSNIDDTLTELQLRERILRQDEITEELLDLVGGAEALSSATA